MSLYPQLEAALLCRDIERKMELAVDALQGWRGGALTRADAPPPYALPEAGVRRGRSWCTRPRCLSAACPRARATRR